MALRQAAFTTILVVFIPCADSCTSSNPAIALQQVLGPNVNVQSTIPFNTAGVSTNPISSSQQLFCSDFSATCRWYNVRTIDQLDWGQASGTADVAKLQQGTGTSTQPTSPFAIVATNKVEAPTTSGILESATIPCQAGNGEVRLRYWTSPQVQLQVCALPVGQVPPNYQYCSNQITSGDPGPAYVTIPGPIRTPFKIHIKAQNFVYTYAGAVGGGYALVDNIEYYAQTQCTGFVSNTINGVNPNPNINTLNPNVNTNQFGINPNPNNFPLNTNNFGVNPSVPNTNTFGVNPNVPNTNTFGVNNFNANPNNFPLNPNSRIILNDANTNIKNINPDPNNFPLPSSSNNFGAQNPFDSIALRRQPTNRRFSSNNAPSNSKFGNFNPDPNDFPLPSSGNNNFRQQNPVNSVSLRRQPGSAACPVLKCSFSPGSSCLNFMQWGWFLANSAVSPIMGDASRLPYNPAGSFVYAKGPRDNDARLQTKPFTLAKPTMLSFAHYKTAPDSGFEIRAKSRNAPDRTIYSHLSGNQLNQWVKRSTLLPAGEYEKLTFVASNLRENSFIGLDELDLLDSNGQTAC